VSSGDLLQSGEHVVAARIQGRRGPDLPGQLQPLVEEVDGGEAGQAHAPQAGDAEEPHEAAADDQGVIAGLRAARPGDR